MMCLKSGWRGKGGPKSEKFIKHGKILNMNLLSSESTGGVTGGGEE